MAVAGWILDKSAAARADDPHVQVELRALAGKLYICPVGELEQLYSARSAIDYDALADEIRTALPRVDPPADVFARALDLQRDLARHHGMWHRTAIPDLLIAETALYRGFGVVHVDRDYERIGEVRPLLSRRLRP